MADSIPVRDCYIAEKRQRDGRVANLKDNIGKDKMMKREFKTEDILTITTGAQLCTSFNGVKELTAFLFGDPDGAVYTLTMADLRQEAARRLIRQHPQLPSGSSGIDSENWEQWVGDQKAILGDSLQIELGKPL